MVKHDEGIYRVPAQFPNAGSEVKFEYDYTEYASIDEAKQDLSAETLLSLVNRMVKVDSGNNARERAKSANGHSSRTASESTQIARLVKAKGLKLEDIQRLLGL